MFFRNKDKILENACSRSSKSERIKQVFERTYSQVYLLTHPYYNHEFRYTSAQRKIGEYHEILSESVKKAGKQDNTVAILTLEMDNKFMLENFVYKYYCKILDIMEKSFNGRLYVRLQTGGFYDKEYHELPIKFTDTSNIIVTARGIYGDRCVISTLKGFSDVHSIDADKCLLNIDESIMGEHQIITPEQHGNISLKEYIAKRDLLYPRKHNNCEDQSEAIFGIMMEHLVKNSQNRVKDITQKIGKR